MNYVWEGVLEAEKEGKDREGLRFVEAVNPSPYMELSMTDINLKAPEQKTIEVNPLYRLKPVFGQLFDRNIIGMRKLRDIFFDVCVHYIVQLDLREGLSREDYYYEMIRGDILNGSYGRKAREGFLLFGKEGQKTVSRFYLQLLTTGNYKEIFKRAVVKLYPVAIVYEENERAGELLVYLGVKETEEERGRAVFLQEMFLPMQETVYFFYEHHFGIIGVDETMELDEMVLF